MTITHQPAQRGGSNTPGTTDQGDSESRSAAGERWEATFTALVAHANGLGGNDDGTVAANPAIVGPASIVPDVTTMNDAILQLAANLEGSPANLEWQSVLYDATANTPDLTVAADQGTVTPAGDFIGKIYVVGVAGTQDLGGGAVAYDAGDWVHFVAANTPVHTDHTTNMANAAPLQAVDATGDVGVSPLAMREDAQFPLDVIPELVTADTTITLDPATGSGAQRLIVLDATGPATTIQPTAGEQVNGSVDLVKSYDTGNAVVIATDVAAGQWNVGPNTVTVDGPGYDVLYDGPWGSNTTLTDGLTWADVKDRYVAITLALNYANSANSFAGHIPTEDIDFGNKTWRYGQDDAERCTFQIGNITTGTTFSTAATSLSSTNRVVVRGIPKERSFQTGTLVAEPLSLVSRHGTMNPGNGNPFQHATQNLTVGDISYAAGIYTIGTAGRYEIDYSIVYAAGAATGYVSAWLHINGVPRGPAIGLSNDAASNFPFGGSASATFALNAGDTVELRQNQSPNFNVAKTTSISIRQISTHTAIRAEDAKLSTDAADISNYTGSPDDATTQGIYEQTTGAMPGGPVANFVWTLDVDVFGDHIKQTFTPRDAGTTVLGYWVRRSFDGGGTWTAWAGR